MVNLTFAEFDKFDRKPFADRLTKAITSFYSFADGAYVLSLNATFGSGKTTFLKMWQHELESQGFKVIYLNAWETDFDEDPIIPLTTSILDSIDKDTGAKKAKSALQGALGATALVGNGLLSQITKVDIYDLIKKVEADLKESDLQEIGKGIHKNYHYKIDAYRKLKEALFSYVETLSKHPLIILVDELDRVRPDYGVKFLEAIKHIFPIQGICFVLAIDRDQLKKSVKQLYGEVDFENYYRRFVTREVRLPTTANGKFELKPFIEQLVQEYFDAKSQKGIIFGLDNNKRQQIINSAIYTSKAFQFTPRQIQYLFRILSHFLVTDKNDQFARESWLRGAILLISIFIDNQPLYHELGQGILKASDVYNYLSKLSFSANNEQNQRYIIFDGLAFNLHSGDEENNNQTIDIVVRYDKRKSDDQTRRELLRMLARTVYDYGDIGDESGFHIIYSRLEDWRSFFD